MIGVTAAASCRARGADREKIVHLFGRLDEGPGR